MITGWWAGLAHAAVLGVDHHGHVEADRVVWETTIVGTGDPIVLATPIVRGRVTTVIGGDEQWDREQLVGVVRSDRTVFLTSWHPANEGLRPPLVLDPEALQQVVVDGHRFVADPELGWVDRVGWTSGPSIGSAERTRLKRVLQTVDVRQPRIGTAIFRVDRPAPSGLDGVLVPSGGVTRGALVVAGGAAMVGIGVLVAGYRWLERRARAERLASYLQGISEL